MKLKVLIVDDERLARKKLHWLLSDFPEVEILSEAESVGQALALITNK
jgi:YesN/AraC family two-component response regulator